MRWKTGFMVLVVLALAAVAQAAGSLSADMSFSATYELDCTDFGVLGPVVLPTDGSPVEAGVYFDCPPGTPIEITAGIGTYHDNYNRMLYNFTLTDGVTYEIYHPDGVTELCGIGAPGTGPSYLATAAGGYEEVPFVAQITGPDPTHSGTYTDSIYFTLYW